MHTVYVGVGSNLGDRQSTILSALQRLRKAARVEAVSSYYETAPANGVAGPAFLNVAAKLSTELDPRGLRGLRARRRDRGRAAQPRRRWTPGRSTSTCC